MILQFQRIGASENSLPAKIIEIQIHFELLLHYKRNELIFRISRLYLIIKLGKSFIHVVRLVELKKQNDVSHLTHPIT